MTQTIKHFPNLFKDRLWQGMMPVRMPVALIVMVLVSCTLLNAQQTANDFGNWEAEQVEQNSNPASTLSIEDLENNRKTIYLTDNWQFKSGDSAAYARPDYDDSNWQRLSTLLGRAEIPFIDWEGIGWFRLTIKVDSSLVDRPLALLPTMHHGASEVYLDGEKLYQMGRINSNSANSTYYTDRLPRAIVFPDTTEHVLAVRYANHQASSFLDFGYNAGFRLLLGDLNHHISRSVNEIENSAQLFMTLIGVLGAFALIHFLLFSFYPQNREHLFFAVFVGLLALLGLTEYLGLHVHQPLLGITWQRISLIIWLFTIIYALRFTYSLFYKKLPLWFWAFLIIGVVIAGFNWFKPGTTWFYNSLFVAVTLIEMSRVLLLGLLRGKEGVWIIGSGLVIFIMGILWAIMVNLDWIPGSPETGNLAGIGGLILSMSVYLSRNVAQTNRRLQHNLVEVKRLSRERLEQERLNREKEIQRKLLEAENERKSYELEEARTLQLSMLPKSFPSLSNWNISVHMRTASEVGGDYYDFSRNRDENMLVTLGDAAGHGMRAGIVVAAAKSYFHTLAHRVDNYSILKQISDGIRNMNVKTMFMGLMLIEVNRNNLTLMTAGMPPALWYKRSEGKVERITQKGLPLGTPRDYPYKERKLAVGSGDCVLIMSDGLMELFNEEREMLGLERIENRFKEVADKNADAIIEEMNKLADEWGNGEEPEDDITILVFKAN